MSEPLHLLRPLSLNQLRGESVEETSWLWDGYLAAGNLTLWVSQWKAGKTTLLTLLLDRMRSGGELAGLSVRPGRAIVLSEEPATSWLERGRRFDLDQHVRWCCRPFSARPSRNEWDRLIDDLLSLHAQTSLSLVAVDPLAVFFPARSENDADAMMSALLGLQRVTSAGPAVLLLHHPRKKASVDGQWSRGSGALCGQVDILIELHWYAAAREEDRRRRLLAWSRHESTPRQRIIELSADGRDYRAVTDEESDPLEPLREVLRRVLGCETTKQTREDIVEAWPTDRPKPHPATLWRLLERGVERGELKRDGTGVRSDPFRYWLPELEELWQRDSMARLQQEVADAQRSTRFGIPPTAFERLR